MLPDAMFLDEAIANLDAMDAELGRIGTLVDPDGVQAMFRHAHSVKGGAAAFGLDAVADLMHLIESVLEVSRRSGVPPELAAADLLHEAVDAARHMLTDGGRPRTPVLQALTKRLRERARVPVPSQGARLLRITVRSPEPDIVSAAVVGLFSDIAGLGELLSSDSGVGEERAFLVRTDVCDQELLDLLAMHVERSKVAIDAPPLSTPSEKSSIANQGVAPDIIGGIVRVDAAELRRLMQLARRLSEGSLVADRAANPPGGSAEELSAGVDIGQWQCGVRALRQGLESLVHGPVSTIFARIAPLLQRVSGRLKKQFVLSVSGESILLDRVLLQRLADPLIHLVRNACDHGVELPEQRLAMGKPADGHIEVSAGREPGLVWISVRDDGAGLSREKVLQAARTRAIPVPAGLDDQGVWQLLFVPGLTTAAFVTDISGRGVGMDVVRRQVVALGGDVTITSSAGQGTCVTMSIPLDDAGGPHVAG